MSARCLTAERMPKADKLLLFKIDLGEEQPRQILAGIAQYYEPENIGRSQGGRRREPKAAKASRLRIAGHGGRGVIRRRRPAGDRDVH